MFEKYGQYIHMALCLQVYDLSMALCTQPKGIQWTLPKV